MFTEATREGNKLRLAIDGPTGSGKTYTALRFAHAIMDHLSLPGRIGVIDTERGSAKLYQGKTVDGHTWTWKNVDLKNFAPSTYTSCIEAAGRAGFDVLIIDSLSHAWDGQGGALDQVDKKAARGTSGGKFGAWREVTPQHRQMIDAMLDFPGHLIVTLRTKMEYSVEKDPKTGKTTVEKIGIKPIQREGVEYEFGIVVDMDVDHTLTVSKTRCSEIDGDIVAQPGATWLVKVLDWLKEIPATPEPAADAEPDPAPLAAPPAGRMKLPTAAEGTISKDTANQIKELWGALGKPPADFRKVLDRVGVATLLDMPASMGEKLKSKLQLQHLEKEAIEAFQ